MKQIVKEIDKRIELLIIENSRPGTNEKRNENLAEVSRLLNVREIYARQKINPNTMLQVGGSILSILLILNYEKFGILNSKAISFVTKIR